MKKYSILFLLFILIETIICNEIDDNGYIMYCPCMGRFGNQADHFLGSLAFAHSLNRTLILPPWVEYRKGETKSIQVPFDTYFEIQPLQKFHKVITMEKFMEKLAPNIWPASKRVSFCYMERKGLDGSSGNGCNAKDGNPFGPFWDTFNVDFSDSTFYEPLNYDVARSPNMLHKWNKKYPAEDWPVLCFTGAPASFPIQLENIGLQKHLVWSTKIDKAAHKFIKNSLPKGAFLGIHLRNGIDWVRACEHIKDIKNLFSSAQCLGYRNEKGSISMEICFPTKEIVVRQLKRQIKKFNEQNKGNEIKSIFVASDSNHMINDLNEALLRMKIKAFKLEENDPHLDLAILGLANHFIGNCVSSYTAFVKRDRDVKGFPSSFWGFPTVKSNKLDKSGLHEEL